MIFHGYQITIIKQRLLTLRNEDENYRNYRMMERVTIFMIRAVAKEIGVYIYIYIYICLIVLKVKRRIGQGLGLRAEPSSTRSSASVWSICSRPSKSFLNRLKDASNLSCTHME